MSGETVIYKNEMNLVPLRRFTATEINLFFAMCNKLKEQDTNTLHLSFDELKELSNYSPKTRNINRFVDDLQRLYDKMLDIRYTIRTETILLCVFFFLTVLINRGSSKEKRR